MFSDYLVVLRFAYPSHIKKESLFPGLLLTYRDKVIKRIELTYDLREIRHTFYPYLLFLNSVNLSYNLKQPINQRMCACKTALNRRYKAKTRIEINPQHYWLRDQEWNP